MALLARRTLPNVITVGRIVLTPVISFLLFVPSVAARVTAFVLFLIAAISDLWDGYLARKHGWITDFGKLVDPIADKLLLAATFLPIYVLSHRDAPIGKLPIWGDGELPLWVLLVIFGREAFITGVRALVARRGVVIPAGSAGKVKAVVQNIFVGAAIVWYALQSAALRDGWRGWAWDAWVWIHAAVVVITLVGAIVLTLYSLVVYLWSWRTLIREAV